MSSTPLDLTDSARRKIEARAVAAGWIDAAGYIRALIDEHLLGEEQIGPPYLSMRAPEQIDTLLRDGLASPAAELTTEDWTDVRRRLDDAIGRADASALFTRLRIQFWWVYESGR